MKNIILGTATGALLGAAISVTIPCCNKKSVSKFLKRKNRFIKNSKKVKSQIIKNIAGIIYKVA